MFKLYNCKVRLGGLVLNEVPKSSITAPEIEVYRVIHGSDAVVDIKETGKSARRSDRDERTRLEQMFAPSTAIGDVATKKMRMLTDLFGHASNPLPKEVVVQAEPAEEDDDAPDVDVVPEEPIVQSKPQEKAPAFAD